MKKRVWEAAVEVLKRTNNPSIMTGDAHLLHEIADAMGWDHNAWYTEARVLGALSKTPGDLIKGKVMIGNRSVLIFRIKDCG